MGKEHTKELLEFLQPFDKQTVDLVMWLRDFAWNYLPETNELIYDNYNAVAFGWSPTERQGHTICSIAIGRTSKNIHFGFYWGNILNDHENILLGEGNQYRYILVTDTNKFPKAYIEQLITQAYDYSLSKVKDQKEIIRGQTIVKSVSVKKRPAKKSSRKNKI